MRSHFKAQSLMKVWGSGSQSGRQARFPQGLWRGSNLSTRGRHRPIVLHDPLRQGPAWMTGVSSLTAPLPPLRCYGEHLPGSRGLLQSCRAGLEPGQSSGDKWIPVFSLPSRKGTAGNALTGKSLVQATERLLNIEMAGQRGLDHLFLRNAEVHASSSGNNYS